MAITNQNLIELHINGNPVELESQDSLNIRITNTLFDPTKVQTTNGEYSYSFEIPATAKNNKILDYANNLSKINKFKPRYKAQLYSDEQLIFDGSLTISKFKNGRYTCNLVNIKINTLEEIFGEETLTNVRWMIDYEGGETIDAVNADSSTKYWFPFVSYGAFIKDGLPTLADTKPEDMDYTSKFVIDNTNRFYLDSFWPSLSLLEEVRKCFEHKGYTVGGNAFQDPILTQIYSSINLADGQQPIFNVGNPKFGKCRVRQTFSDSTEWASFDGYFQQDLKFPYFHVGQDTSAIFASQNITSEYSKYNFSDIFIKNLWKGTNSTVTFFPTERMFNSDEGYVEIPADGFYKIDLSATASLDQTSNITATQWIRNEYSKYHYGGTWALATYLNVKPEEAEIDIAPNIMTTMPIEIQLVKNYENNIELIKGKYNMHYTDGNPAHATYTDSLDNGISFIYLNSAITNAYSAITCYPHEQLSERYDAYQGGSASDYFPVTNYGAIIDTTYNMSKEYGYVYSDGRGGTEIMCYDPVVSDAFICGISTMGTETTGGTIAFRKDGYSWSKQYTDKTYAMYNESGYVFRKRYNPNSSTPIVEEPTNLNVNSLPDAPLNYYYLIDGNRVEARVSGMVFLKKGDILNLMLVKRGYWQNSVMKTYQTSVSTDFTIEAASPRDYYALKASNYGWTSATEYESQLNLMNFTNAEKKISDWLKNVQEAFNLEYNFNGQNVDVNINRGIKKTINYAIDIDDRVNASEVESEFINYPRDMSVRYKIDTDEHGFYKSVPADHINYSDWKNWGDSGFTIIKLSDDSYSTTSQNKNTDFSYTWYDTFNYIGDSSTGSCTIPVIQMEEYMIENYNDYEAMYKRGYKLTQRFWFRTYEPLKDTANNDIKLRLRDDWDGNTSVLPRVGYNVKVYAPQNNYNDFNLSYKDTETSLMTTYFNVNPMLSSNYVTVETFLKPIEYINLKNGAMVHLDSNLHYVSQISGFDPSSRNKTKLKLITKV